MFLWFQAHLTLGAFLAGAALQLYDQGLRRRIRRLEGSFDAAESEQLTAWLSQAPLRSSLLVYALLLLWPELALRLGRRRLRASGR